MTVVQSNEASAATMFTVKVNAVRKLAEDIHEYELVRPEGEDLPGFTPGSHVHVAVPAGGTRQYSLASDPADRSRYVIAIKREPEGEGGSTSFIDGISVGDTVEISEPRNDFELREDAGQIVLIAGGIGITPIYSMALTLCRTGKTPFHLYYLSRSPELTAYADELSSGALAEHVTIHHDHGDPARSLDLSTILDDSSDTALYCCGPTGLLHAVRSQTQNWPRGSVRFEDFGTTLAPEREEPEGGFWVKMADSGERYFVPPDKTILKVLQEAGLDVPSSCEAGTCATCRMQLIAGEADHRDLVLFDEEMDDNIIICCSRAKSDEIIIAPVE